MELNEALNVVENVKNRYQAFEKLEEVLIVARQQETLVAQRAAQLEKLNASIEAGRKESKALDAHITEARVSVTQAEREAAEKLAKVEEEIDRNVERMRALAADQIAKFETEQKAREESFKSAMLDMAEQEAKKRGEIAALDKQIDDLKATARKVLA